MGRRALCPGSCPQRLLLPQPHIPSSLLSTVRGWGWKPKARRRSNIWLDRLADAGHSPAQSKTEPDGRQDPQCRGRSLGVGAAQWRWDRGAVVQGHPSPSCWSGACCASMVQDHLPFCLPVIMATVSGSPLDLWGHCTSGTALSCYPSPPPLRGQHFLPLCSLPGAVRRCLLGCRSGESAGAACKNSREDSGRQELPPHS